LLVSSGLDGKGSVVRIGTENRASYTFGFRRTVELPVKKFIFNDLLIV